VIWIYAAMLAFLAATAYAAHARRTALFVAELAVILVGLHVIAIELHY
jgi:hypothetical protein